MTTWCEGSTHWKRPWCWERLKVGGEEDSRGWDGWMASLTQWTWVWVGSGSQWWTGKPGVLQSMGSQRVRHDWVTELELEIGYCLLIAIIRRVHSWYGWNDYCLPIKIAEWVSVACMRVLKTTLDYIFLNALLLTLLMEKGHYCVKKYSCWWLWVEKWFWKLN